MIIWGSCGKEVELSHGEFYCPDCDDKRLYVHKRLAKYFTLYFIPLFQTDNLGEYVECKTCHQQFKPEVLTYTPPSKGERLIMALRAELDSGLPIHMVIQKLISHGVEEDTAKKTAIVAAGENIQVCCNCNLHYRETVKKCLNCGGPLGPFQLMSQPTAGR
ncbi:MAG TPA: zinc-ribbon domain-containing protein [Gemmataceae bacterium]|nr:zinc-ribbon domain-containing protein [Gemmataceae bacterium]